MKKQILFLFAAASLFAACSSDDVPTNGNNPASDDENMAPAVTATSTSVTTEEGFGMTVGAIANTQTATKADSEADNFTLILPDDILGAWACYIAEADDFYITKTVNHVKDVVKSSDEGLSTSYGKIKVTDNDDLSVTIDGINVIEAYKPGERSVEYSFEVYIWIRNSVVDIHTGPDGVYDIYGDGLSYTQKLAWIGLNAGATVDEDTERGMDFTADITKDDCKLEKKVVSSIQGPGYGKPYRYIIRYNVYRGLQGTQFGEDGEQDDIAGLGNTPYVKVSIQVVRLQNDERADEIIAVLPK